MNHSRIKDWRKSRYKKNLKPDDIEKLVIDTVSQKQIVALDCAGWILNQFGFEVQSFESDPIAQLYDPNCYIEPDLFYHRPTYTKQWPVLARYPWYLKYSKVPDFVNFLELWTQSLMILNFSERHVQHNHLKYQLIDVVRPLTSLHVEKITNGVWLIKRG